MSDLDNISILLVETQSAGNIGSVARAMKNMGLRQLVLVNCQTDLTEEAFHLACGADDLIQNCQRSDSLPEALAGFDLSVGTSSRLVHWIPTAYGVAEMAERLLPIAASRKVALVFGPERTGLTNEHLQYCQWLVTIPTDPAFESMNLSHAVAIVAYEFYRRFAEQAPGRALDLASLNQVEAFYVQLQENLGEMGFLDAISTPRIMATLRQIFARAALEKRDVSILRGILRQWRWYAKQLKKPIVKGR
jgi:TrmH family RNA methyltransferase